MAREHVNRRDDFTEAESRRLSRAAAFSDPPAVPPGSKTL
jgi:hypothetical protein